MDELEAVRAENKALREALEDIVNPIEHLRRSLKPGEQIDGMAAIRWAESIETLRDFARAALAAAGLPQHDSIWQRTRNAGRNFRSPMPLPD